MIDKAYNDKYFGICDTCGEITDDFDTKKECEDWVSNHWRCYWDDYRKEYVHLCEKCMNIK